MDVIFRYVLAPVIAGIALKLFDFWLRNQHDDE